MIVDGPLLVLNITRLGQANAGQRVQMDFRIERLHELVVSDDPRPSIPRRDAYPVDWYTEDEYRDLLGGVVREAA